LSAWTAKVFVAAAFAPAGAASTREIRSANRPSLRIRWPTSACDWKKSWSSSVVAPPATRIVARPAVDGVGAVVGLAAGDQNVVAVAAFERVAAVAAVQHVVVLPAVEVVVRRVAAEHRIAGARRVQLVMARRYGLVIFRLRHRRARSGGVLDFLVLHFGVLHFGVFHLGLLRFTHIVLAVVTHVLDSRLISRTDPSAVAGAI